MFKDDDRKKAIQHLVYNIAKYEAAMAMFQMLLKEGDVRYALKWKGEGAIVAEALLEVAQPLRDALHKTERDARTLEFIKDQHAYHMRRLLDTRSEYTCTWSNCIERLDGVASKSSVGLLHDLWEILDANTAPGRYDHLLRATSSANKS